MCSLNQSPLPPLRQEFDEAIRGNQTLRKEVTALQAERAQLQQHCESRSQHCMTLIAENKRLADQVGCGGGKPACLPCLQSQIRTPREMHDCKIFHRYTC